MYKEFFGLDDTPFTLTPDPRFIVFTPSYNEVLASLYYGLENAKGLIVLTGEVGDVGDGGTKTGRTDHGAVAARQAALGYLIPARVIQVGVQQIPNSSRIEMPLSSCRIKVAGTCSTIIRSKDRCFRTLDHSFSQSLYPTFGGQ